MSRESFSECREYDQRSGSIRRNRLSALTILVDKRGKINQGVCEGSCIPSHVRGFGLFYRQCKFSGTCKAVWQKGPTTYMLPLSPCGDVAEKGLQKGPHKWVSLMAESESNTFFMRKLDVAVLGWKQWGRVGSLNRFGSHEHVSDKMNLCVVRSGLTQIQGAVILSGNERDALHARGKSET